MPQPLNYRGLSAADRAELEGRPTSIGQVLDDRVAADPDGIGWRYPDEADVWRDLTWTQFRDRVHTLAAGLLELGLARGARVAIVSSTRLEWILADLANNCAGGATTSIYPNTAADDAGYILQNSGSCIAVVENPEILGRVTAHDGELGDQLRWIVLIDGSPDGEDPRVITWADLEARGRAHLAANPGAVTDAIAATGPDDLATLIYTSGTTGRPKGVELTHDNWIYVAVAMHTWHLLDETDVHYLWLPMSHVFGKCLVVLDIIHGTQTAVDGRVNMIVPNLAVVRPTLMCGAPRVFEKVRAAVLTSSPRGGVKGKIARWAFAVGSRSYAYRLAGEPMPPSLAAKYKLADRLVFSKLREKMGGRIRFFVSGSAKLSPQVQRWFYSAGLILIEGYGMTETTAVAYFNNPLHPRFGTVGEMCPGSEVRFGDDGEILLRGPGVTRGYYRDPERTAEAIIDGWLHTGDIGELDREGNLRITDRKKDLMKTSGGKYVSPQEVESVIAANCPYVSQVVAVGEGRKYVAAILTLDRDGLLKWGRKHNLPEDYAALSQRPEIRKSIDGYIAKANSRLERWETVKRYAILDHELEDSDDITPNMKIRRAKVIGRYADVVAGLYDADGTED